LAGFEVTTEEPIDFATEGLRLARSRSNATAQSGLKFVANSD
jgi:hypothetical protein